MLSHATVDNVRWEGAIREGVLSDESKGRNVADLERPLIKIIKSHETWILTGGKKGEPATLDDVDLRDATDLENRYLSGISMRRAILCGVSLKGSNLIGARLEDADLRNCSFFETDLRGANLRKTKLSNADLRKAMLSPLDTNRKKTFKINLSHSQMRRADLRGADLSEADLAGSDLRFAQIHKTKLDGVILEGAKHDLKEKNLPKQKPASEPKILENEEPGYTGIQWSLLSS